MNFHPYSIERAPKSLPIWQSILDDLGNPHPTRIAKVLGLGARTIYRYNREAQAPRHVCLALFWLTRWGHSQIDCQAVNDCQLAVAYANALEIELRQTRTQLAHVLALGNDSGAANQPLIGVPHVSVR
jgi:predicted DNA-binding transcriptional regulator AlpA